MRKPAYLTLLYALGLSLILSACTATKPGPIVPGTLIPATMRTPPYPPQSLENEEVGSLTLMLRVDTKGKVTDVRLVKSSGFPRLDRSALKTVQAFRFTPATQGKKAIPFQYKQTIHFSLPTRHRGTQPS